MLKDNLPVVLLLFSIGVNTFQYLQKQLIPVKVIAILQAEVKKNRTIDSLDAVIDFNRDSVIVVEFRYLKELTEANTLMLCGLSPNKVILRLPCARLEREWGIR